MNQLAIQEKSWFSIALDLMVRLNSGVLISQADFVINLEVRLRTLKHFF